MRVIGTTRVFDELAKQAQAKNSASAESAPDTGGHSAVGADSGESVTQSPPARVGCADRAPDSPQTPKSPAACDDGDSQNKHLIGGAMPTLEPHAHWLEKGTPTQVSAREGRYGPIVKITHGALELEGNAQVVRSWINSLRSEVLDAIARAERAAAA